mmetsp:Transcript_23857/g.68528  ORF Transcript_23857/g.68528 Transcript_23857/m.68528 type:complete len:213 (+) Transcript_23857:105-743(+)
MCIRVVRLFYPARAAASFFLMPETSLIWGIMLFVCLFLCLCSRCLATTMSCSAFSISRRVYPKFSMRSARRSSADRGSALPQRASKLDTRRGGRTTYELDRTSGGPRVRHEQLVVSPIRMSKDRVWTCPKRTVFSWVWFWWFDADSSVFRIEVSDVSDDELSSLTEDSLSVVDKLQVLDVRVVVLVLSSLLAGCMESLCFVNATASCTGSSV